MVDNPVIELTQAVFSTLTELGFNVSNELLPTGFPVYILGEHQFNRANLTKDNKETTHFLTVHAWSQSKSSAEVKNMVYLATVALQELTETPNFHIDRVGVDLVRSDLREAENVHHGVIELEFQLTEK